MNTYLVLDSSYDASGAMTDTLMFGATIQKTGFYDSLVTTFFAPATDQYITSTRIYGPDRSNGFGIADSIYYEDATDLTVNNATIRNERYIGKKFYAGDEVVVRFIITLTGANDVVKIDKVSLWGREW